MWHPSRGEPRFLSQQYEDSTPPLRGTPQEGKLDFFSQQYEDSTPPLCGTPQEGNPDFFRNNMKIPPRHFLAPLHKRGNTIRKLYWRLGFRAW
jgi:hypothetical protein